MPYYIAIDGGGTKTEGVLADREGTVLARAVTGPSNPNDTSVMEASRVVISLAETLISAIHEPDVIYRMYAGISGAMNHRAEMENAIAAALPRMEVLEIGSDVGILLSAELPTGDGACIICGTGSACFLRKGHDIIRIGGWGYLLDSGGSGYDMGRDALEAVLRAHDGRGEGTILETLLEEKLGAPVWESITTIYEGGKTLIASCAPKVFAAAERMDAVAVRILTRNAGILAEYIQTAYRQLTGGDVMLKSAPFHVIMGGSISQKQAPAFEALVAAQVDPMIPLKLTVASHPPVLGALLEAIRRDGQGSARYEGICERFSATYSQYL